MVNVELDPSDLTLRVYLSSGPKHAAYKLDFGDEVRRLRVAPPPAAAGPPGEGSGVASSGGGFRTSCSCKR